MEPNQNNLYKNTQEILKSTNNEDQRFRNTYNEINSVTYNEEESLALRTGALRTGALSFSQLYLLRSQILAYKHMVRNVPIPTSLSSTSMNLNIWEGEKQRLPNKAISFYRQKLEKEQELKNMIISNVKPSVDQIQQHLSVNNSNQQVKILVEKRKSQIDNIIEKGEHLDHSTRERLQIEGKFLNIRDIYQKVLYRVTDGFKKDTKSVRVFERQLLDRNYFRIEKLQRNKDSGNRVQKLENQMKSDHQRRKKIKHKQFMQHLRLHKEQFLQFHRKKQKDRKKIIYQTKAYFETKKKNKEDFQDKQTIARLKALKQQNMEEYFRLFKQAKNNKIKQLLSQTNKFLKDLGAKVLVQKGQAQDQNDMEVREVGQDDIESTFNSSNNIYYNLTHTVKEQITKQPSILEGGQLKHYQIIGLQWLVSLYNNNLNGILADEMGLGKTIQTISLIAYLIQFKKNYGPFLIVVPLSTITNWVSEFEKWAPSIKKIVYRGNPTLRNQINRVMKTSKWNVCITTYDFILKDRLRLNKYDWKYIVIDEGHKMKNAKSKFAGVLGQQYQSDHRLLLTGTPLQNNLTQLWALLNFLLPKVFNSCDDFEKWFSMAIAKNTGGESVQLNQQEQLLIINRLHQVLRPFLLRRIKKEVQSQLPQKREHVIKIQLSAWQKHIYNSISQKTALQYDSQSGKITNSALSNLMMQLRKCCNHPYLFLKNYDDLCFHDWIFRTSGKFQLLDRILPKLKEFNHRVLIFTQMTHLMDIMQIYFEYKGVKHLRLDGSTKSDDRGQRTTLFNQINSQYDVFLLSTRAGGLGLNLQTADTVILFDSDWNPQMDLQAQDRAHRIGQKKQVIVLRFVTNTPIEEAILQKAAFKINLNELFIQGGLYNLKSNEAQRRQKIEDVLKKANNLDESQQEDQIPDDSMINKFISRNQEQYERYTKMDEQRYEMEKYIYPNFIDSRQNQGQKKLLNYRLMAQDEIPKWFLDAPVKKLQMKEYGRGNRVRRQINYSDQMTDDQFLKQLCEQDLEDDQEELIAVPEDKKSKLKKIKNKDEQKQDDYKN